MVKGVLTMKISVNNQYAPGQFLDNRLSERNTLFHIANGDPYILVLKAFMPAELQWLRRLESIPCHTLNNKFQSHH